MENKSTVLSDQELIDTEIDTLEKMNKMLECNTENVQNAIIESPTEVVEKKLSDFISDAFNATNKDFAFQEKIKDELTKRLASMTDNQLINLLSNNFVNLNDRVSKVISPTFGMMQTKQQAEIAAAKAQASQQIIVNPGQSNVGNVAQNIDGSAEEIRDILAGGTVLTQLLQAIGQSQTNETTPES